MSEKLKTIEAWLQTESGRSIALNRIRELRLAAGRGAIVARSHVALTVKRGARYSVEALVDELPIVIKGLYVGKRGGVIFTFDTPKKDRERGTIEVKFSEGDKKLKNFGPAVTEWFGDVLEDFSAESFALLEAKELEKLEEAKRAEQAKAQRYVKNTKYGSW